MASHTDPVFVHGKQPVTDASDKFFAAFLFYFCGIGELTENLNIFEKDNLLNEVPIIRERNFEDFGELLFILAKNFW